MNCPLCHSEPSCIDCRFGEIGVCKYPLDQAFLLSALRQSQIKKLEDIDRNLNGKQ
jgi:hypothetical protein